MEFPAIIMLSNSEMCNSMTIFFYFRKWVQILVGLKNGSNTLESAAMFAMLLKILECMRQPLDFDGFISTLRAHSHHTCRKKLMGKPRRFHLLRHQFQISLHQFSCTWTSVSMHVDISFHARQLCTLFTPMLMSCQFFSRASNCIHIADSCTEKICMLWCKKGT